MDIITLIVGGALVAYLSYFILRLMWTIGRNLINGRRFYQNLEAELDSLRLSRMLEFLGIDKKRYVYQNQVNDIKQQMNRCSACDNTATCDEKLAAADDTDSGIEISAIDFCNNEADLASLKQSLSEESPVGNKPTSKDAA